MALWRAQVRQFSRQGKCYKEKRCSICRLRTLSCADRFLCVLTQVWVDGKHFPLLARCRPDRTVIQKSSDVLATQAASAVVVLGDSITDGHGATTDGNDRWTDVLAQRLTAQPAKRNVAVLNQGIGGNHLLTDGLGPNALSRLDHDVIAQPGVRFLIILEGINDIGMLARKGEVSQSEHDALVRRILAAYEQIITRAHSHDIKVIGATLTPFAGLDYYHPEKSNEADRVAVNDWIRTAGHFDSVIDFDKIVRDREHPDRLLPAFDCGDHLHPSPAGYAAMAQAIPLSLFVSDAGKSARQSSVHPAT